MIPYWAWNLWASCFVVGVIFGAWLGFRYLRPRRNKRKED